MVYGTEATGLNSVLSRLKPILLALSHTGAIVSNAIYSSKSSWLRGKGRVAEDRMSFHHFDVLLSNIEYLENGGFEFEF